MIEKSKLLIETIFTSFEEAEKYLKRMYEAYLVRDEVFVEYLMNGVKKEQ